MTESDLIAIAQFVFGRIGDALPVLLGGAGGVVLVWWLDGRRESHRDRRRLLAALSVVTLELARNIAMADQWAVGSPESGPIKLRSTAWERNQDELARHLPRDLVGHLGAAYNLVEMFETNIAVAQQRGRLVREDQLFATRVRDTSQAVLRELQAHEGKLGVKFTATPAAPAELRGEEKTAGR